MVFALQVRGRTTLSRGDTDAVKGQLILCFKWYSQESGVSLFDRKAALRRLAMDNQSLTDTY